MQNIPWKPLVLTALGLTVAVPQSAYADVCWTWEFGKKRDVEAGTFTTDGSLVGGSAPAGSYSILDFAVTDSTEATAVGASLGDGSINEPSPIQTFYWNGSTDTLWTRDDGFYTDVAAFDVTGTGLRYIFGPGHYLLGDLDSGGITLVEGSTLNLVSCALDPDLVPSLSDSADPVSPGESYNYTLTVDNVGDGDASDVEASTTLSGVAHTVTSASASQGSCVVTGSDVDCSLGSIASSAQATVTITVEPGALGTITADSAVDSAEDDATPANNTASESTEVVNASPDCAEAAASTNLFIADPFLGFVEIEVVGVTDPDGDPITITIDGITQDEPTCGLLDPCSDANGVGTETAEIRKQAALLGLLGNGRVYHIGFTAEDGNGGSCEGEVTVGVKPLISSPTPVDDSPPSYDSTL